MSREIKFRAWDKKKSRFVDFGTVEMRIDDSEYTVIPNSQAYIGDTTHDYYDDRRWEITQYTGLFDKQGVEIYEGDILKFTEVDEDSALGAEETCITQVKWIDDLAQWRVVLPSGRRTELWCILQTLCFYDQEVIGNIYENPELIGDNNE